MAASFAAYRSNKIASFPSRSQSQSTISSTSTPSLETPVSPLLASSLSLFSRAHPPMRLLLSLLLVANLPQALATSADSQVIVLDEKNFDTLTAQGSWILDFYAPWCGHCRRLEPEFEKAAKIMQGKVMFGKVDCTRHSKLRTRFGVKGYPTLKFMRDGEVREYHGGRQEKDLVKFAKAVSGDPILPVRKETADAVLERHPVSFVFLGASKDGKEFDVFDRVARRHQGVYFFGSAFGKSGSELASEFGVEVFDAEKAPVMLYLTRGGVVDKLDEFDLDSVEAFVSAHRFGLVTEINADTFSDVAENGNPVFLAVVDDSPAAKELAANIYPPALAVKPTLLSAKIDGPRYKRWLSRYGLTPKDTPCLLVIDFESEIYWRAPPDAAVSAEAIEAWLQKVIDGSLPFVPLVPWYNPRRYMRKISKFMQRFSETQIMIITIMASVGGAALLFAFFTWLEGSSEDIYSRATSQQTSGASGSGKNNGRPKTE